MLVRELVARLQQMPQNRIVEVCIPADETTDPDEAPTNTDDLYSDVVGVFAQGEVVVLKGTG